MQRRVDYIKGHTAITESARVRVPCEEIIVLFLAKRNRILLIVSFSTRQR